MVMLRELQGSPWTTGDSPLGRRLAGVEDDRSLLAGQGVSAALLQAEIDRSWAIQDQAKDQVTFIAKLYEQHRDSPLLGDDILAISDAELFDAIAQVNHLADWTLDELEPLSRYIRRLERFRDQGIVWSSEAQILLAELRRVESLYEWFETIARQWSEQLCAEYLRRHPELPRLPFEPIDFGPTNSARLPPAI